jgi:exopolysaccharide biosynthesis polyprenyl glycosylphosphotransferase
MKLSATQPETEAASCAGAVRGFSILHRRGRWRDALRRRMLAVADGLAVLVAASLGTLLWDAASPLWALATLPVWLVLAKLYGLYDNDHRALRHLTADELRELVAWTATGTATYVLLLSTLQQPGTSAVDALRFGALVVLLAPALRAAARAVWRSIVPSERALLVGSGPLEEATRRKLELFGDIHVDCVGVVTDVDLVGLTADDAALDLQGALSKHPGVDRVIVASEKLTEPTIAGYVATCRRNHLKLSVVPPARSMFGTAVQLRHVADLPMIEYSTWDSARSTMFLKRCIDIVVSGLGVVVLSPFLLALAAAVRLSSPGPAFFVQVRAGLDGRPFHMLKFRTMGVDAEMRLTDVIDLDQLTDPMFKLRRDPRVTPIGRFLRRTSLDELPQLFNVLRGDMSLVGPRPEQLDLVERYGPEHRFRLTVKPGLTGPMQVYGRGELRFDERLAVEREYIENLSISRDLRIMALTVAPLLRGRGAF